VLVRVVAALAALVTTAGLAACSSGGDDDGGRSLGDVVRDAVEQAKENAAERSGETRPEPSADVPIGTDGRTTFEYAEYDGTVRGTIGLLEEFWSRELPTLGGEYRDPSGYSYYRSDEGAGPACGQSEAPAKNAFYCPAGDFIAWDETGLLIPYYVQGGDFAAAFVLAHEFGHAMQTRLPRQEQVGVLRELQADCFAGAWAQWTSERGLLEAGDLDEATLAVFTGRDLPGTPWTDPQAHGSGFERTRAFGDGFEAGARACYPAPGEEWVIAQP
jgi:hypothetical protein